MGQLSSAIKMKCPKCGHGELFANTGILPKKGMFDMKTNCDNCGLKYEKEIGYFYGAMFISYALNIALFVTATVIFYLFLDGKFDWRIFIGIYLAITLLLIKWIYRMSRSIWLMLMISYEPNTES